MPADKVSAYRSYLADLTEGVFAPSEITRVSVQQGHEDDTLLKFFPNGFIVHDGPRIELAAQQAKLVEGGALYRVQGPFGEQP